jgi:hypothetical protein
MKHIEYIISLEFLNLYDVDIWLLGVGHPKMWLFPCNLPLQSNKQHGELSFKLCSVIHRVALLNNTNPDWIYALS